MRPCPDLKLFFEIPDPANEFFVLDNVAHGLLDNPTWLLAPDPLPAVEPDKTNAFVLDVSKLEGPDVLDGALGDTLPGYKWHNLIRETAYVQVDRGVDFTQSVSARPVAGVLTAQIVDPYLDGLANHNVGLDTRVRLMAGGLTVFQGNCESIIVTYDATSTPIATVKGYDAVAAFNAVNILQRPSETYEARVKAIAKEAGIPAIVEKTGINLNQTEKEVPSLTLLNETIDSEGALVWVDRFNTLHALTRGDESVYSHPRVADTWDRVKASFATMDAFLAGEGTFDSALNWVVDTSKPKVPASPLFTFSNSHDVPGHICLTAFADGMDTTQVINSVTFRWRELDANDPANARWETLEATYDSATSKRYYGASNKTLNVWNLAGDLQRYADHIFREYDTPKRKVAKVAYISDDWQGDTVRSIVTIDVADVVRVVMMDPVGLVHEVLDSTQRVAQISHRISPEVWETQLALL